MYLLALLTLNYSQLVKLNQMSSLEELRQAAEDAVALTPNRSLQLDIRKMLVHLAAVSTKYHRLKEESRQVLTTQEFHQRQLIRVRLLLLATNAISTALATALDTVVVIKALLVFAGL
jgi:hypothetical protein